MKKIVLPIMLAASLGACASVSPSGVDPQGRATFTATCGGGFQKEQCFKKAAEVCAPGQFQIIGQDKDHSSYYGGGIGAYGGAFSGGSSTKNHVKFICVTIPQPPVIK